jgi:cytochrome c-type biogenesis protein CcmH
MWTSARLLALAALVASGCSRSGSADAPPPTTVLPAATASLPPGHPPLDAGGSMPHGHPPADAVPAGDPVRGTVTLAPALREQAPKGAVLFLIARAADRRIVAVRREDAAAFPYAFELSAGDAMTDGSGWSGSVEITARLSRSGDAAPASGDIEGRRANVPVGSKDVRIELDQVRP